MCNSAQIIKKKTESKKAVEKLNKLHAWNDTLQNIIKSSKTLKSKVPQKYEKFSKITYHDYKTETICTPKCTFVVFPEFYYH